MKRSVFALVLLAMAGSAWAQPTPLITRYATALDGLLLGTAQFPGGLARSTGPFLAGDITNGFVDGRNGFIAFAVLINQGTKFEALGALGEKSYNEIYNALLPAYQVLTGPAERIAAAGVSLTKPLSTAIVTLTAGAALPGLN